MNNNNIGIKYVTEYSKPIFYIFLYKSAILINNIINYYIARGNIASQALCYVEFRPPAAVLISLHKYFGLMHCLSVTPQNSSLTLQFRIILLPIILCVHLKKYYRAAYDGHECIFHYVIYQPFSPRHLIRSNR